MSDLRGIMSVSKAKINNTNKNLDQDLIDWRRSQVVQLLSKGKSVDQIADILQVDPRTIYRDQQYIRQNAIEVMSKYLTHTVPYELVKCLSRLNAISDEAWAMVESSKDAKERGAALALASKTAIDIIDVVTNNKSLVYEALNVIDKNNNNQRWLANKNIRTKEPEDSNAVFE
jgi:hypothetical protein